MDNYWEEIMVVNQMLALDVTQRWQTARNKNKWRKSKMEMQDTKRTWDSPLNVCTHNNLTTKYKQLCRSPQKVTGSESIITHAFWQHQQ